MRYAVFSDIHAHLGRLEGVLAYLKGSKIDQYICLGDIVGYGIHPNECVERIRKLKCPTLMGNHDSAAIGLEDINHFNYKAYSAILWTQKKLKKKNKEYLKTLPFIYQIDSFLAVHSTPRSPEKWNYILTADMALKSFQHFKEQICFIGHSHIPFFFQKEGKEKGELIRSNPMEIKTGCRYLVNVGSVGQPRDNNPKSAFIIFDDEEKTVTLKRLAFDGPEEMLLPSNGTPLPVPSKSV